MPRRNITDKQREEAWDMYQEGNKIIVIARTIGVSYVYAWSMTQGRKQGFKNNTEYQQHLVQQRGFKNFNEYEQNLAQRKGFKNFNKYQQHLAQLRSQRKTNKKLSHLIKKRLQELDKNKSWLAKEIGVSRGTISDYTNGSSVPRIENAERLSMALEINYRKLEDLLKDD